MALYDQKNLKMFFLSYNDDPLIRKDHYLIRIDMYLISILLNTKERNILLLFSCDTEQLGG